MEAALFAAGCALSSNVCHRAYRSSLLYCVCAASVYHSLSLPIAKQHCKGPAITYTQLSSRKRLPWRNPALSTEYDLIRTYKARSLDHELPKNPVNYPLAFTAAPAMDIPAHILDAISIASDSSPPKRLKSSINKASRKASATSRTQQLHSTQSSAEDLSSTSDSGPDHDYQTDYTTPNSSDSYPDDMQPDDVEDFRDREYPQLKGKTYLDHGGTTVRICVLCIFCPDTDEYCSCTQSRWWRSSRRT